MTSEIAAFALDETLRRQLQKAVAALEVSRAKKVDLEHAITEAATAAFADWEPPKTPKVPKDGRTKREEVAVAMVADWHLNSVTPDYNMGVAERRVLEYARKILSLSSIQRADHPVRSCRVWVLGDLVAGEQIFPGQEHEIDASVVDQAFGGARLLRDFLLALLEGFERVEVVAVPGNHGRIGGKRMPYHPDTNADRILYMVAREATANEPRVTWTISRAENGESGRILVDRVGNYSCLLSHGELFRGGNSFAGLPYYSFANKALKWRDMSMAGQMPQFTDLACGHWHRTTSVEVGTMTLRVCGTLQTYDPFSREVIAAATRPSQSLIFCHPEAGRVTAEYTCTL
jgi:hypothetical protein